MRPFYAAILMFFAIDGRAAELGPVRDAALRSVQLIERVNGQWKSPCVSCHNQVLGTMALDSAHSHGVAVDAVGAHRVAIKSFKLLTDLEGAVRIDSLIDPAVSESYMLLGARAAGYTPSLITAIYARHIARAQQPDGHWGTFDARPPHGSSEITATALAAEAIRQFLPPQLSKEKGERLAKARAWLSTAVVFDTEDATFKLFGLLSTGAKLDRAAKALAALQQPDGSWRQNSSALAGDAYSTGQALVALRRSGVWAADRPAFLKGIAWLVRTQAPDGSWLVKTRLHTPVQISPDYFESGFPYGKDQFISTAGTAWAAMALTEALPLAKVPSTATTVSGFDPGEAKWMEQALFGTPAELSGIDPNAATREGTTALMMAADDPEKVRVLLARGAKVDAVNEAGYDALMMACLFGGNVRTVAMLLDAGLTAKVDRKVRFQATALSLAVMSQDSEMARLLLSKGADPNFGFRLLGGTPAAPLTLAANFNDAETIKTLAAAGAKLDAVDADKMTALAGAALSQKANAVKALLDLGAARETKDRFGLTPAEHSKAIPFGAGATAKLLDDAAGQRKR